MRMIERTTLRRRFAFVGVTAAAAAMLGWVAIMNGYPLIFADSSRYLNGGILRYLPVEAPIFYGVFMIPFHLDGVSLWPVVVAQCLVLAYVVTATLRALGLFEERSFVVIAAFLALFTTAPWFTAFIMPDIFTPVCVLAMFALFRGWEKFVPLERLVLVGLALLALASHVTHIFIGLGLAALFATLHFGGRRVSRAALLAVVPLPLVALAAIVGMNLLAKGRLAITPDGPVFLLARVFADGPAYEHMREHCGERQWKLCAALPTLPRDSDLFLWSMDNSVWSAAPREQVRAEAGDIVASTLRERPGEMLVHAIGNTLSQLVSFRAGVDFKRWPEEGAEITAPRIIHRFFPHEFDQLMRSRQQQGRLETTAVNLVYSATVVLSVVGVLLLMLRTGLDPGLVEFLAVVATALVVNAAAAGALSVVADRYQARIVWLVPLAFAVSILVYQRRRVARLALGSERSLERSG
jgi:hypothetical protein